MGGSKGVFPTTHWSLLEEAKTYDDVRQRLVMETLVKTYWKPVYCYLRRKGYANEPAKDLTQGFFHELVIGRELVQQADQAKGRFRTFLLTSLDNYVISAYRNRTRKKRYPKGHVVALSAYDHGSLPLASQYMRPDEAFTYVWASTLLDDVLEEVKDLCHKDDMDAHWKLFFARVVDPILNGTEPDSLGELCNQIGLKSKAKASNMIVTVKRRFQSAMRDRVRRYVDSDEDVDQEIHDLMKILSMGCAS